MIARNKAIHATKYNTIRSNHERLLNFEECSSIRRDTSWRRAPTGPAPLQTTPSLSPYSKHKLGKACLSNQAQGSLGWCVSKWCPSPHIYRGVPEVSQPANEGDSPGTDLEEEGGATTCKR
jgi:hypothetical protein